MFRYPWYSGYRCPDIHGITDIDVQITMVFQIPMFGISKFNFKYIHKIDILAE